MNKGRIEANPSAEKSFLAELESHLEGLAGGTEIDEIECLVAGVVGASYGSWDIGVIAWTTIAGGDAAEGDLQSFPNLVRSLESRGQFFPEILRRERVLDAVDDPTVGIDDFPGGKMPQIETEQELVIALFILEGTFEGRGGLGFPRRTNAGRWARPGVRGGLPGRGRRRDQALAAGGE